MAKKKAKMPAAYKGKSTKPGGGGRFAKLVDELEAKGARNPKAVAAKIGRKKYGAKQMTKWAVTGRKRTKKKGTA